MPIVRQPDFEGAIYMENNLTIGAFNEERLEVMNMLAAQASISIENAQLYNWSPRSRSEQENWRAHWRI